VRAVPVTNKKELLTFITYPHILYKDSPHYVPHLVFERKQFFNPGKNPFFSHADVEYFLAIDDGGSCLGRISAHVDWKFVNFHKEKTGFFGFYDSVEDEEVTGVLLEAAENYLRKKEMEKVIGPMNFNTNDEVGILREGFDSPPYIMMPYNYPYYGKLLERSGYVKEKDLFAYYVEYPGYVPGGIDKVSRRAKRSLPVTIRNIEMKHFERELDVVKRIYNSAWEKNWGFVPMDDKELEYLAENLKPVIDPSIVFFAMLDDEEVGFFIAIPDFNMILKELGGKIFPLGFLKLLFGKGKIDRIRVLVMGVVEKYRRGGIEAVMLEEIYRAGPLNGFAKGELSWILEDNWMMNKIISRLTGEPYKTYRVYGKEL